MNLQPPKLAERRTLLQAFLQAVLRRVQGAGDHSPGARPASFAAGHKDPSADEAARALQMLHAFLEVEQH